MKYIASILMVLMLAGVVYADSGDIDLTTPEVQPSITKIVVTRIEIDSTSMIVDYAIVTAGGVIVSRGQERWTDADYQALKDFKITLGMAGDSLIGKFRNKTGQALKNRLNKQGNVE